MPKRVDHEERRRAIAEALWRIACERGLDGAGLRDVAAEAGISLGQLQHYFTSKDDMLGFALDYFSQLAERRVRARIEALPGAPTPYRVVRETLAVMMPLDHARRTGNLVQIAYFARALHDERLRARAREGIPALLGFLADQLRLAAERGELTPGRDPGREAALLLALVDGLTNYALLEVHSPQEAMGLVDLYLEGLFAG